MTEVVQIAETAALLGDPARANMLLALMDGGARTAKELAFAAHVSAPTASGHLGKLAASGLLAVTRQGRHRYYRLASPSVGAMMEALMAGTAPRAAPPRPWRGGEALRTARTCYDHLAGRLGVAIADSLVSQGRVVLGADGGEVTEAGHAFLRDLGADPARGGGPGRVFCRTCLDWSERRPHLAGRLGAALCARCLDLGWVSRQRDTRAVAITPAGRDGFARMFGIALEAIGGAQARVG